jgi:hypothetical protein
MPDHNAALDRPLPGAASLARGKKLLSPRLVVLDPNIAMEDVPGCQTFFAGTLASPRQRFKTAVGNAGGQINEVILACVQRR